MYHTKIAVTDSGSVKKDFLKDTAKAISEGGALPCIIKVDLVTREYVNIYGEKTRGDMFTFSCQVRRPSQGGCLIDKLELFLATPQNVQLLKTKIEDTIQRFASPIFSNAPTHLLMPVSDISLGSVRVVISTRASKCIEAMQSPTQGDVINAMSANIDPIFNFPIEESTDLGSSINEIGAIKSDHAKGSALLRQKAVEAFKTLGLFYSPQYSTESMIDEIRNGHSNLLVEHGMDADSLVGCKLGLDTMYSEIEGLSTDFIREGFNKGISNFGATESPDELISNHQLGTVKHQSTLLLQ